MSNEDWHLILPLLKMTIVQVTLRPLQIRLTVVVRHIIHVILFNLKMHYLPQKHLTIHLARWNSIFL